MQRSRLVIRRQALRDTRLVRGYTQAALAELAGITTTQLARIESGRRGAGVATVKKLADALGVDPLAISILRYEDDGTEAAASG